MGESMVVDCLNAIKIGDDDDNRSPSKSPALEVSVSFGKFENDLLAWEKWSCFSPNKHLEDVEKCKTLGSVAQKKAYFEAHYQKIAAKKIELVADQEKQMCYSPLSSNSENNDDVDTHLIVSGNGGEAELGISSQEIELDDELSEKRVDETNEDEVVKEDSKLDGELNANHVDERNENGMTIVECQSLSSVKGVKEETNCCVDSPNPSEEGPKEMLHKSGKVRESTVNLKEENKKLHRIKDFYKATPVREEKYISRINKKPISPMPKPQSSTPPAPKTQFSSPRVSKPAPTSLTMSMSRSSMVNVNSSSLLRSKKLPGESKKVASKSLNMSLNLDSPNPDPPNSNPPSLMTTRKSFIMEQMGDKEIVKRAFKSFQKNYNKDQSKSSDEVQSAIPNQVPTKTTQERINSMVTPQKESGRILKTSVMDKKNAKAAPSSSFGLKNDDKIEKRREFSKMLEEKSIAREAGKTQLQTKPKVIMREDDMKHMVHWGLRVSRKPSDKGVSKNEHHTLTGPTGLKRNHIVTRSIH
ncbi:hypothetical protein ACFE04_022761 [Oxalis oulophora]